MEHRKKILHWVLIYIVIIVTFLLFDLLFLDGAFRRDLIANFVHEGMEQMEALRILGAPEYMFGKTSKFALPFGNQMIVSMVRDGSVISIDSDPYLFRGILLPVIMVAVAAVTAITNTTMTTNVAAVTTTSITMTTNVAAAVTTNIVMTMNVAAAVTMSIIMTMNAAAAVTTNTTTAMNVAAAVTTSIIMTTNAAVAVTTSIIMTTNAAVAATMTRMIITTNTAAMIGSLFCWVRVCSLPA